MAKKRTKTEHAFFAKKAARLIAHQYPLVSQCHYTSWGIEVNTGRLIISLVVDIIKQDEGGEMMQDMDLFLQEIGQRISERRRKLGLTQEALAEKADVTTQFVSYAEAGKRAMRPENLKKLAKALGVSADYLLTGDVVEKDLLLLSNKLQQLTPPQLRLIENIIDECSILFNDNK